MTDNEARDGRVAQQAGAARRPSTRWYFNASQLHRWLKKALSVKARRRRAGGRSVLAELMTADPATLLGRSVDASLHGDDVGANRADLLNYLKAVEKEFHDKSEILLHHAKLIVLMRRDYRPEMCFRLFERMWQEHSAFLLKNLDLRWLLSANDTFLDLAPDREDRLVAGWTVVLANTIKLSETEHIGTSREAMQENLLSRGTETEELFDGLQSFRVGHEDTLFNMRRRLESVSRPTPPFLIFWEVFARMQEHDTSYARFRALHQKRRTRWW